LTVFGFIAVCDDYRIWSLVRIQFSFWRLLIDAKSLTIILFLFLPTAA
jgi:hypothetical protein